jgi:ribonucleoside-diphosphate reductase alpha chain
MQVDTRQLLSDSKFYESYSRFISELNRYERWDESVSRVMNMHREYYKDKIDNSDELKQLIEFAEQKYKDKHALGAQRALQFGGEQLLKHPLKMFNCISSYADRPAFFGEILFVLLCGNGAGFSVQYQHVNKLPKLITRTKAPKVHTIDDSIEGWATALDVLMSSFF